MKLSDLGQWFDATILELGRQFRWSYLPPLMVYFAAGVSGLTAIVGTFFVKEYLDLSAAFIAGLAFWAGIPWVLKMPLGHLVDLIWRWKYSLGMSSGSFASSLTPGIGRPDFIRLQKKSRLWMKCGTQASPASAITSRACARSTCWKRTDGD